MTSQEANLQIDAALVAFATTTVNAAMTAVTVIVANLGGDLSKADLQKALDGASAASAAIAAANIALIALGQPAVPQPAMLATLSQTGPILLEELPSR